MVQGGLGYSLAIEGSVFPGTNRKFYVPARTLFGSGACRDKTPFRFLLGIYANEHIHGASLGDCDWEGEHERIKVMIKIREKIVQDGR